MFKNILFILLSYIVGSISFAYYIGKRFYSIDIRKHGSGNPGTTNVLRSLGKKPAIIVLLTDFLKGLVMVYLGKIVGGHNLSLMAGIAVVVGHNWSIFLMFKGGKGIATSLGVVLGLFPKVGFIILILGVIVIALSRYVSLGSVIAAVLLPLLLIIFRYPINSVITGFVLGIIALYRHRDNIKRLLAGNENKLGEPRK